MGLAKMSTTNSLQEKRPEKVKDPKNKIYPLLVNVNSDTLES